MDLHSLPSYYGHDANSENGHKSSPPVYKDRNFNNTSDPHLRSSSAPPPPEPEKPKKRHFRVFSRKDKKDKKTNGELNSELVSGAKLSWPWTTKEASSFINIYIQITIAVYRKIQK